MNFAQTHTQVAPAQTWTINHEFTNVPISDVVTVIGGTATKILPMSVKAVSDTQLLIEFSEPYSGVARLYGNVADYAPTGAGIIDMPIVYPIPSDTYFSDVGLLLDTSGLLIVNEATANTTGNALTANGDALVSSTQQRFGHDSVYFDGSGDFVESNDDAIFEFADGDFTLEAWVWLEDLVTTGAIVTKWGASTDRSWALAVENDKLYGVFWPDDDSGFVQIMSNASLTANAWHHVACVRESGVVSLFIDGIKDTSTLVLPDVLKGAGAGGNVLVGINGDGPSWSFNGYITQVRTTQGTARYSADFAKPTALFPTT